MTRRAAVDAVDSFEPIVTPLQLKVQFLDTTATEVPIFIDRIPMPIQSHVVSLLSIPGIKGQSFLVLIGALRYTFTSSEQLFEYRWPAQKEHLLRIVN